MGLCLIWGMTSELSNLGVNLSNFGENVSNLGVKWSIFRGILSNDFCKKFDFRVY